MSRPISGTVIASHRYGWTMFEIVSLIAVVLVPGVFAAVSGATTLAGPIVIIGCGLIGCGLLWNVGRSRKNASALTLVDDDGTWRLLRHGVQSIPRGTEVPFASVSDVIVMTDTSGERVLVLTAAGEDDTGEQSLRLPERLLQASPGLCAVLQPTIEAHADARTRAAADTLMAV